MILRQFLAKCTAPYIRARFYTSYKSLLLTEQAYMKKVWKYSAFY